MSTETSRPGRRRTVAVLERSFAMAARNRAQWVLLGGYVAAVVGLAVAGGAASYLEVVLDLLGPLSVLVPVLAVALGYRAVLGDAERGELAVLRTFPLTRHSYVAGTFLGRLTVLLAAVLGALVTAGLVAAALGGPESTVLATHAASDSPLLVARFAVLTAVYAAAVLAAVVALSSLASAPRVALALGGAFVVLVGVGLDLTLVGGLAAGVVPEWSLQWLLALSPASAYRGLVLWAVAGSGTTGGAAVGSPPANLLGLTLWLVGSLAVAVRAAW